MGGNAKIHTDNLIGGTRYAPKEIGFIESGSNSNGDWMKFPDGTILCFVGGILANYLSGYNLSVKWTFPHSFSTKPTVIPSKRASWTSAQVNGASVGIEQLSQVSCTAKVTLSTSDFSSNSTRYMDIIAIGK